MFSNENFNLIIWLIYLKHFRLFVRVINEYTSTPTKGSSDEQAIYDNSFTLIFAFDEIVALGLLIIIWLKLNLNILKF